jgi:hypothetical protein
LPLTTPSIAISPSDFIDKEDSEPPTGENVPVLATVRRATLVMLRTPEYVAAPEKYALVPPYKIAPPTNVSVVRLNPKDEEEYT